MAPFPDVERALLDLIAPLLGSAEQTGTETPADLQQRLPFGRVTRVGGPDDGISDRAVVDVDVFAATRSQAYDIAESVRQLLLAAPHAVAGVVLDSVGTIVGPRELPWADENVRRWSATYRAVARR